MSNQGWSNDEGYAVYVHIPFCVSKCPYCDFVSKSSARDERAAYIKAVREEILNCPVAGSRAATLFLGGGTPTELTGDELESIVDAIDRTFSFDTDAEWTIECNPGTVNPASCDRLYYLGFNRVSIGTQSFKSDQLLRLGRIHSGEDALRSFNWFRTAGFENINLDLIFGTPDQSVESWNEDLSRALDLRPEHLSLYNLTIEQGTPFASLHARGELPIPSDDIVAQMFESAMDLAERFGYQQYEISNYALPGYECVHNLAYWSNSTYLGFGLSAASFVDGVRWVNTGNWESYIEGVKRGMVPKETEERLGALAALGEEIMLRLRTRFGISPEQLSSKYSTDFNSHFGSCVEFLIQNGLLVEDFGRLRLTRKGKLLANDVCAEFLNLCRDTAS
ncbi:MAG: radical SAM family heme chaperone HemW [Acidobacteriota bacterium]|nr:MAG: radical SAM family heme chaperone HemW [Acidobacteriota bacterium]